MLRKTILILASFLCLVCASTSRGDEQPQVTPDVIYGHKDGMALVMHAYRPAKANGAAVVQIVSGGYFSNWEPANAKSPLVKKFLDAGFTVFSVFHGSNPRYTVPEIMTDMRRAIRFIRLHADDYRIDAGRVGVMGSSAGGHLALMLATTGDDGDAAATDQVARTSSRVAAAVAIAAPSDMRNIDKRLEQLLESGTIDKAFNDKIKPAFAFDPALRDSVSPLLHVTRDDAPTMLIHGDADKLVSIDNSHRILAQLQEKQVPCELVVLPGVGHGPQSPAEWAELNKGVDRGVAWFEKNLTAPQPKALAAGDYSFDSAGAKIHYVIQGEGPPVVMVHGFTSSIVREWERFGTLAKLSKGYQVIALDNRGHGQSDKPLDPKQYGVEMANDVVRLMDHLGIKKAHLVGYSMGGVITEYLLVHHPDRFFTATIGGMGWIKPDDERVGLIEEFATALETGKGMAPLIDKFQSINKPQNSAQAKQAEPTKQGGQPTPANQNYTAALQMILTNNPKALLACLRGIPTLAITEQELKANKVPALAIVGGIDEWKVTVDEMEKVMANLQVEIVAGTDHATCLASPKFADGIKAFLDAHSKLPGAEAK